MARVLKWFLYLLGFIVFLFVLLYAVAQFNRPRILETLNTELKNGVNGDFQIGQLDFTFFEQFPNFSITLSDLYLRGPNYEKYHKALFKAEKIYVHVRLRSLLAGNVNLRSLRLKNAQIFIFRTKDGYSNKEVFKKKDPADTAKESGSMSLSLGNLMFEDSRFTFVDSLNNKSFDIKFIKTEIGVTTTDSSRQILFGGPMWFGGLEFNSAKGGYLSNVPTTAKLDLEFIPGQQRLLIKPSVLQFPKSKVNLAGHFDFSPPGTFVLGIQSDSIDYAEGLTLVTRALREKLSKFSFAKPLYLNVKLDGTLAPAAEPKIDIAFSSKGNEFATGKLAMHNMTFGGTFMNHLDSTKERNDHNSRVAINNLTGKFGGVPIDAKISITDLIDPRLTLETKTQMDLVSYNKELDTTRFRVLSGALNARVSYDGRLSEYMDQNSTSYEGKLNGSLEITNGSAEVVGEQKKLSDLSLKIGFNEKQMDLEKINYKVNGNALEMKGKVTGFIPFFFKPKEKGFVDLSLYSPRMDLGTLIKKKAAKIARSTKKGGSNKKIADLISTLNEKVEFNIAVAVDEVVNGPLKANQLTGNFSLQSNKLTAGPVKLKLAGGAVQFSMAMSEIDKPTNPISVKAEVKEADIRKLLIAFDNFSQSTIKSNNLSGKVSANVQMSARVDEQFKVLPRSMVGKVEVKVKNGRLEDFEPLQKMSNFLFKKRDFTDIKFAEIRSRFAIKGQTIDIARMEIESSVLSMFVEGQYSAVDKDDTDFQIQVPLSNLKKRDKNYKPQNVGTDAKVGPSVFLRVRPDKEGKMGIAYDPFNKFKKKKG